MVSPQRIFYITIFAIVLTTSNATRLSRFTRSALGSQADGNDMMVVGCSRECASTEYCLGFVVDHKYSQCQLAVNQPLEDVCSSSHLCYQKEEQESAVLDSTANPQTAANNLTEPTGLVVDDTTPEITTANPQVSV